MSTFDEALHPRVASGQFAGKVNAAPNAQLAQPAEDEELAYGHSINSTSAHRAADEGNMRAITRAVYETEREVVDASTLKAGDTLLWWSLDDASGKQFWEETVTHAQVGIDLRYRRVVTVESAAHPSGPRSLEFRASDRVSIRKQAEEPLVYPELRYGMAPERLSVVVEDSDEHGSTVALRENGSDPTQPPLDRFRVSERLPVGGIPLRESSRSVQACVADRFVPLSNLDFGEFLRREPLHHGGRAWND